MTILVVQQKDQERELVVKLLDEGECGCPGSGEYPRGHQDNR